MHEAECLHEQGQRLRPNLEPAQPKLFSLRNHKLQLMERWPAPLATERP